LISIHPIPLVGPWQKGFALDKHTLSSVFLGSDEFGHDIFDTKRSEVGELLYRLKYRNDETVLPEIVETVARFVRYSWKIADTINGIVPVPPSKTDRRIQPVLELAKGVGAQLNIPVLDTLVTKIKSTSPLKNIDDYQQRPVELRDAFSVNRSLANGKTILLVDDLYQSGATLNAITKALQDQGNVKTVFALTVTKTRG
jgi:competence protein ComFC